MARPDDLDLLLVASNFSGYSGPNSPLLDLANFLHSQMGVRCAVVTHGGPVDESFAQSLRVPTHRSLSGTRRSGWARAGRAPLNLLRLRRALRALRPKRVLAASGIDLAFELSWAMRRPIPVGYNVFFNWSHRNWIRSLELPLLPPPPIQGPLYETLDRVAAKTIVQGVLAHTEFHRRLYRTVGIPDERIRVVPHAIDAQGLRESAVGPESGGAHDERLTVLYVGRLEPDKGIRELLEASVAAARDLPLRLQLVGGGSQLSMVNAFIRAKSGKDGLELAWLPPTSRARVAGLIRESDIVALPSRVEGFGMVALEAMTFGKPVIATRYGGIAEIVRDRVDGWLIDPLDLRGIAQTLVTLGGDASLRRRLGKSGKDRVEAVFDVARVAPQFERAMESIT